ncbi:hypothetical protein [Bradyrhizobium ottawaense]|uniref:hypothetical protein n=1 Tax=Bradyrhizobium ottawaense TaxID=931866 RepID=UPI0027D74034|nr:hypothetical protein BwSH12_77840 [Bradyrhizobium ottawaense]GMO78851.1 hypothetical protein BwSG10_48550 [Bradyrhizobium ottawaense]GMP00678.1 hypothetical protein BwSH20_29670 [Bradyrhizobium ottawaense]GMP05453.1 hypothetical protein BwDG23_48550 [Bradyrhizobium ottawaense]
MTELTVGKTSFLRAVNGAMQFRIETAGGSVIQGWIPANTGLEIFHGGDVTKCDLTIPPDARSGPVSVENK